MMMDGLNTLHLQNDTYIILYTKPVCQALINDGTSFM